MTCQPTIGSRDPVTGWREVASVRGKRPDMRIVRTILALHEDAVIEPGSKRLTFLVPDDGPADDDDGGPDE